MIARLAACLLAAALLAACTNTPTPPRVAAWVGEQSNLLFMRVIGEEVLRDARLTAPGGQIILTQRLSSPEQAGGYGNDGYGVGRPSVGVGVGAGSSGSFGTGIGLSFPVLGGGGAARPGGLSTQAEFNLTPEQLASYRARPQDWLLELRFDRRIASMPAPDLSP